MHYPTDINLLWDAMRCALRAVNQCCLAREQSHWRQWQHHTRQVKKAFRKAQTLKHSSSKYPEKRAKRQQAVCDAHQAYLVLCTHLLARMDMTRKHWEAGVTVGAPETLLERWVGFAYHQIDLIQRRVLTGETIPHAEKVFSIFEDYSEWLCKGKAGVPVELGLAVCVMESSDGFILHHKVMQHCTDSDIAVDMVRETQALFPALAACSFDKGFHSPANQLALAELLAQVTLPRKGRLSKINQAAENDPEFTQARRQHSAVESGINALEVHGLDRCPDRGLDHFKRYVALAVVGRNLQKIGAILQARALKTLQRQIRRRQAA